MILLFNKGDKLAPVIEITVSSLNSKTGPTIVISITAASSELFNILFAKSDEKLSIEPE